VVTAGQHKFAGTFKFLAMERNMLTTGSLSITTQIQKGEDVAPPAIVKSKTRRTDLDWLRIGAVLLLVPFHSALIFVLNPQSVMYVKDITNSMLLDRLAGWVHQFHMPLLFYVSGASAWFALQKRNSLAFISERFSRLLLPAVAGMAILIPPMTYIALINQGVQVDFARHFISFWRINPQDLAGMGGTFTPAHLWFLVFLFVFTMAALPFFLFLNSHAGQKITGFVASVLTRPGMLFLIVIPLYLAARIDLLGDKNPWYYFAVFFLGYLLFTDSRYLNAIDKSAKAALITAVMCELLRQFTFRYLYGYTGYDILRGIVELGRWSWVLAIAGYGRRFLNNRSRFMDYLSLAAFPFYLLHLPVNTFIGYLLIKTSMPVPVKYILIVTLTTAFTFLLYEGLRRVPLLRLMLGVKPVKPMQVIPAAG
jgi:glucans biosynthesis protein C